MGLITKAKGAPKSDSSSSGGGVKYICNICSQDVTATVRIRCASKQCPDYDLCVDCFSKGEANLHHDPRSHPYQVIEPHSIPIFDEGWGADEELLLLEGAEQYGLGSWADIADHIGGFREKDEVRDHYIRTYVDSALFPLPERASPADKRLSEDVPREEFQARKKRRIDARKEAIAEAQNAAPAVPTKPTSSGPSCHEVSGYMPGRLEFENEYFNEAEEAVQHMQFSPEEGVNPATRMFDPETELKMVVMGIYNDRLTARTDRKRVIFNHQLLEYRKNLAQDKKRTKEQRDLHHKLKPFARMMSHPDFVSFSEDLEKEHNLRQAIAQLQEWRRMRISTLATGEKYESEKAQRIARTANQNLGQFDRMTNGVRVGKGGPQPPPETAEAVVEYTTKDLPVRLSLTNPNTSATTAPATNGALPTPPPGQDNAPVKRAPVPSVPGMAPISLSADTSPDLQLLLPEERELCSKLNIQPKAYLAIKDAIFREAMKSDGKLKKKNVREISRIDTTRGGRVFEFLVEVGWLGSASTR
ncbi:Transcriptional adapter ada2 [Saxophila tyrrhenica]|uniref:Transcriptional adapter 2 n=1 Tax=Saxophila tyrrhenica TaxID=1690608 RepID=A0AAV9P301_9PEZI|nr:Transcriptional adapter ada2 [Saxophila tyrrhenica]